MTLKKHYLFIAITLAHVGAVRADAETTIVTPTIIKQANVTATGFTISSSGTYWLGENINFTPAAGGNNAINISASNVTLDLKGFSITQTNALSANGIVITGNFNDITIQNGRVRSFSNTGISIGTGGGVTAQRIRINNMSIISCLLNGITIIGLASPNVCRNIFIENCLFNSCCANTAASTTNSVISSSNASNVFVTKTSVTTCGTASVPSTSTVNGLVATNTNNVYLTQLVIESNLGGAGTFNGITLTNCANVRALNCSCNRNTAATFSGYNTGSVTASRNILFHQCELVGNSATTSMQNTRIAGNAVFRECIIANNSCVAATPIFRGFDCFNTNNLVLNCLSQGNSISPVTALNPSYRLDNLTAVNCGIIGCISNNNTLSEGFYLYGTGGSFPLRCIVRDCASLGDSNFGFFYNGVPVAASTAHTLRNLSLATLQTFAASNFPAGSFQQASPNNLSGLTALTNSWTNVGMGT